MLQECEESLIKAYRDLKQPLLNYILTRIPNGAIAEELAQETFFKAFRFRSTYNDSFALTTWLWSIARNTVTDHLRSERNQLNIECEESEIASESPDPESLLLKKDERRVLIGALSVLTRLQKRVIWLRSFHHLSFEDISKRLGLTLSATKSLAQRAKDALLKESSKRARILHLPRAT